MAHPLTEAYQKAHKNYVLFSGLLLGWELIGFKLPEDGKISSSIDVTLLNPEAVPWVLLALVFYFGFRTWNEFQHCDVGSASAKSLIAVTVDHTSAHVIGVIAIAVYTFQNASDFRLAETLLTQWEIIRLGFILGVYLVVLFSPVRFMRVLPASVSSRLRRHSKRVTWSLRATALVGLPFLISMMRSNADGVVEWAVGLATAGLSLVSCLVVINSRWFIAHVDTPLAHARFIHDRELGVESAKQDHAAPEDAAGRAPSIAEVTIDFPAPRGPRNS